MTVEENKQPEAPGPQKRELPEGDDNVDLKGKGKRVKTEDDDYDRAATPGPQKPELPEGDDKVDLKGKGKMVKADDDDNDRAATPDLDPNRANDRLEEALLSRALFGTPSPPRGNVPEEFKSKFPDDRALEKAAAEAGYYSSPEPLVREGAVARQGYRPEDNMPGPSQHGPPTGENPTGEHPGFAAADNDDDDDDESHVSGPLTDYLAGYQQGRLDILDLVRVGILDTSPEDMIDQLLWLYSAEFGFPPVSE
jgi:hypothetical protein